MLPIIVLKEREVWQQRKPKRADHIRVNRVLYYHHGIYVSDEEVIHFTGSEGDNILGTDNEVIKTDLSTFLKDSPVEVKIYNSEEREDLYSPDEIVNYARSRLGDTKYNLVLNNCEHFANMCTLGRFRSKQVENFIKTTVGKVMGICSSTHIGSSLGINIGINKGIDSLLGVLGKKFGGNKTRETITTTYEPDKIKVAEIESQTKLMLADNQTQYNQIIAKSQEFIGATNTYKALTNNPNNQYLLDNQQDLSDNEANNSHQIPYDEIENQDSVENNQEISNTEEIVYEN